MSHSTSNRYTSQIPHSTFYDSPYGRLFGKLDPWQPPGATAAEIEANIRTYASTQMFRPEGADDVDDNEDIPAGYTYFGQIVDHDITFDPTSSLQRQNDPNRLRNFRTPRLDLDNLYGEGPDDEPFMYDGNLADGDGFTGYFLTGKGGELVGGAYVPSQETDLPRNSQGRALIGDMRNDENVIVSQLQLAFVRFHNRVLAAIASGDPDNPQPVNPAQFKRAQKLVRWTYQFVVWNDWVKRLVNDDIYKSILKLVDNPGSPGKTFEYSARFYHWKSSPFIPVEFSVAAYRFGHSMVRPTYLLNVVRGKKPEHEQPIFDPTGNKQNDLSSFNWLKPHHTVQWNWFLIFKQKAGPQFPLLSQKINPRLSRSLFHTPAGPGGDNPLAFLNIMRNWRMGLPSGPDVARAMGETPLQINDPMEECLWVYILKEAAAPGRNGKMLGPVGGRIVAETLGGLLAGDPLSYVNCDPNWQPMEVSDLLGLGDPINGEWDLAEIIRAAKAPIKDADSKAEIGVAP